MLQIYLLLLYASLKFLGILYSSPGILSGPLLEAIAIKFMGLKFWGWGWGVGVERETELRYGMTYLRITSFHSVVLNSQHYCTRPDPAFVLQFLSQAEHHSPVN